MDSNYARGKICVLALGGNSLIKKGEQGTIQQQEHNAEALTEQIFPLIERGYNLVITHGNGPQVGNQLIRNEATSELVPAMPLDVCVSYTEGSMGYILQQALLNGLRRRDMKNVYVVTMITEVLVDRHDPAFRNATKPVGPFYEKDEADRLTQQRGWTIVQDAGRGFRRVVPSPRPLKIVQRYMIRDLCRQGNIVIALGGGGVPIWKNERGDYEGVEAVIDKDLASSELAQVIHADLFVILTPVPCVYLDFNKPTQRPIGAMSLAQARHYLHEGQFPPGSMGPKVLSVIEFLEKEDAEGIITNGENLSAAMRGKAGTIITR